MANKRQMQLWIIIFINFSPPLLIFRKDVFTNSTVLCSATSGHLVGAKFCRHGRSRTAEEICGVLVFLQQRPLAVRLSPREQTLLPPYVMSVREPQRRPDRNHAEGWGVWCDVLTGEKKNNNTFLSSKWAIHWQNKVFFFLKNNIILQLKIQFYLSNNLILLLRLYLYIHVPYIIQ